jgi:hypothetical protein
MRLLWFSKAPRAWRMARMAPRVHPHLSRPFFPKSVSVSQSPTIKSRALKSSQVYTPTIHKKKGGAR